MSDIEIGEGQPIPISPTNVTYPEIESAYKLINDRLFGGELPPVLITLQRKEKRVAGYFSPRRFVSPIGQLTDELALNPAHLGHHNTLFGLQTIGHEMCHIWQFHFGNAPRKGYHNKEFAAKMESIGLMPSETGKPGGNKVGQKMDDYVIEGGPFEQLANDLIGSGFKFPWSERDHDEVSMDLDRLYEAKNAEVQAKANANAKAKASTGPAQAASRNGTDSGRSHPGEVSFEESLARALSGDGISPFAPHFDPDYDADEEDVEGGQPHAPRPRTPRSPASSDHSDAGQNSGSDSTDSEAAPMGEFSGDPVDFNGRDFENPGQFDTPDFSESAQNPPVNSVDSFQNEGVQQTQESRQEPKQKSPGRIAFICPCKHRIWGKPSIYAFCGHCKNQYLPSTEE